MQCWPNASSHRVEPGIEFEWRDCCVSQIGQASPLTATLFSPACVVVAASSKETHMAVARL